MDRWSDSTNASRQLPTSFAEVLAVHRLQLKLCTDLLAGKPPPVQRLLRRLCRRDRRELDVHEALREAHMQIGTGAEMDWANLP